MATDRGLVWRLIDATEKAVAPALEDIARSGQFAELLGLTTRLQSGTRKLVEARTRALWHLVNLPAATDVTRVRRQVTELEADVLRLTRLIEQAARDAERRKDS